ncbi:MAG TPA: thioredoxin family protein [Lacipirellulaceae bacterium]|nr:thioredoxin family protein [Lacipirellulaceae bacterium]
MRHFRSPFIFAFCTLLVLPVLPAKAQQEAVHWHDDLESAKLVAKQTGRLVLIHFWTPSCGPCLALNRNVFSQPGVAGTLETQFVPVKLNADENPATAQSFGITRVPTDVIVSPDGQVVAKLISPPTPAAYVAEVTAAAGRYATRSGQAYANAAANAPMQSQLNAAYANLPLSPPEAPALAIAPQPQPDAQTASPYFSAAPAPAAGVIQKHGKHHKSALAVANSTPGNSPATTPQVVTNPAANALTPTNTTPAIPSAAPNVAAAAPAQVANPYIAATTSWPPTQSTAAPATIPLTQSPPPGYVDARLRTASAANSNIPPVPASTSTPQQTSVASAVPDVSKLPAGAPPLGFEGYCPVSMRNKWKWVPGDPRWGVVHRGRTYWFAGPDEQKQFWSDPDHYAPALSGVDPVLAMDHQQQVPGKREHSLDYDGLFYMFASEATLQQFTSNPQRYATAVRQAMGIQRGRLVR